MNSNFKYRVSTFVLFVASPALLLAAGPTKSSLIWAWILNHLIFLMAGAIILGMFLALWNMMESIVVNKTRELYKAKGIAPPVSAPQPEDTILVRWYKKAWNLVPIEKEADIQLDHDYDGIKELDNSLPPWWLYGFYLSIIIAVGYMYVYQFSDLGLSQQQEYEIAIKEGERQKVEYAAMQANNIDESNLLALTDEESLTLGSEAFIAKCATCHGPEGQGGIGPNLTDKYWIHGGSMSNIYQTIKYGVPEKGMIAWKAQMRPIVIHKVASYIQTLQGTNPANAKPPQGDLYEEENATIGGAVDQ